jgi:DNA oxidative demethylase
MPARTLLQRQLSLVDDPARDPIVAIAAEVILLSGFADTAPLRQEIAAIEAAAPFRHLTTPGGGRTSVAMTNCGAVGWHSDADGYRYLERDPLTGRCWPPLPSSFRDLALQAVRMAGFAGFDPDCCLVNRYEVGTQMGTHRDFDEKDLGQPIVSVSIGLPATFLWYGASRRGAKVEVPLSDGDVVVWGGRARAGYHAVRRLRPDRSGIEPPLRYNLTFRRAR